METDDELDLPRGVALAWGVAAHPQRGPKRELSIERIVEAAIEIADAEGLGAVSMSAVAGSLGFTTMSLYRYVTNKDELLMVMGDAALGLPPLTLTEAGAWRERLAAYYREVLAVYEAHPWLLDLPIAGVPGTPGNAAWFDAGLATLEDTPLDWLERTAVLLLVMGQVRWTASVERGYVARAAADGVTPDDLDRVMAQVLGTLVTAEAFPSLRAALDSGVLTEESDPFAFGLERLLDGVALHVAARTNDAVRKPSPVEEPATAPAEGFPKDPKVREARAARREAEKAVREAERRLREATKQEREAVARARERAARDAGGQA
ncbi:TetR/AcrR family transcriptional regulator [Georgenia phoenicis]|uniref:TetR/AcrR family transcriptional regulator n=1 Tax=unclassified Georgenia TaxID=2626815 RepID=UPI0039B004F0